MEFVKKAIRVGNSAGILLPKKLLGAEVKVQVIKRQINLKKEIIKLSYSYIEELECIFLINESPIEAIAISNKIKKILKKSGIKLSFVSVEKIIKDMKKSSLLREKILNAKPILNKEKLELLKKEILKNK